MSLILSTAIILVPVIVFTLRFVVNFIKDSRTATNIVYYSKQERSYYDPVNEDMQLFPTSMHQNCPEERLARNKERVDLSIIVPAYNEELRLPLMLDQAIQFLENRCESRDVPDLYSKKFTYEIIIVDDGSVDETSKVGLRYSSRWGTDKVRVLTLERNRGKGGAVRLGVLASRGKYILFADADGASEFKEIQKLEQFILEADKDNQNTKLSLAIGSRAHLEKNAIAERSLIRTVLMKGFHLLVWSTCVRSVRDTQCGFKLFNRPAAKILFNNYHNESWAFDVELLYLAEQIGCAIGEISINWNEIGGSKIVPVLSWLRMGIDVVCIAFYYFMGIYQVPNRNQIRLEVGT